MNKFARNTSLFLGSAVILVLAAGFVRAAPSMGGGHGPMGMACNQGCMMGAMLEDLDLDLDQGQLDAIHGQMQVNQEAMAAVMEQMRGARQALAKVIHAPDFDEAAIRAAAADMAGVEGDLAVARARMLVQVRDVLTPEQQEKVGTLMDEHLAGMGEPGCMMGRHRDEACRRHGHDGCQHGRP